MTEDSELARALRSAAPLLAPGLPRSQQVRELAIAGAQHLVQAGSASEKRRGDLLDRLASQFAHPETAPWDSELLRDVKRHAWRSDR